MAEPLAERVTRGIDQAAKQYYRLIIVVGPAGAGKTAVLRDVHQRMNAPLVNVNLELSRRMLDLTERQRTLQLPHLLSEIVNAADADVILLDNIEVLFDISLKQDPLRLLQTLSRNKTVVAAWPGVVIGSSVERQSSGALQEDARHMTHDAGRSLVYATSDHPEYRRYPLRDFLCVCASSVERHASGGNDGKD